MSPIETPALSQKTLPLYQDNFGPWQFRLNPSKLLAFPLREIVGNFAA